jgi:predicted nucleic acid-binding protein
MNIFIDANILVTVIKHEQPFFDECARVLSLSSYKYNLYITALTLGICFYQAEKKFGKNEAKRRLRKIIEKLMIARCDEDESQQAFENVAVNDFEDGLQYYSAVNSKCYGIVTYNVKDFHFSKIPVFTPVSLLLFLSSKNK